MKTINKLLESYRELYPQYTNTVLMKYIIKDNIRQNLAWNNRHVHIDVKNSTIYIVAKHQIVNLKQVNFWWKQFKTIVGKQFHYIFIDLRK